MFGIIICSSSRPASPPFIMVLLCDCGLEKRVASTPVVWPVYIPTISLLGKHQMILMPALPWILRRTVDDNSSTFLGQREISPSVIGALAQRLHSKRITETVKIPGLYPKGLESTVDLCGLE